MIHTVILRFIFSKQLLCFFYADFYCVTLYPILTMVFPKALKIDLKGTDMVKSWPGPGQKYNVLYSTASTHLVLLCS